MWALLWVSVRMWVRENELRRMESKRNDRKCVPKTFYLNWIYSIHLIIHFIYLFATTLAFSLPHFTQFALISTTLRISNSVGADAFFSDLPPPPPPPHLPPLSRFVAAFKIKWVLPYSPLLRKRTKPSSRSSIATRLNRSSIHICKYINKGSDVSVFGLGNSNDSIDENDQLGRYFSSNEACHSQSTNDIQQW